METAPRILVVEDNAALSGVLRFNLMRSGFDVDVAENGQIALDAVLENRDRYDLVITDHQMPEMTGIEMCEKLRELDGYQAVPVILLTAKRLELDIEQVKQQYALSAIYPKPFSPNQIVEQAQELVASIK